MRRYSPDMERVLVLRLEFSRPDIIVCATTSSTPIFSGRYVSEGAHVCALGSHEPRSREVDGFLVGRSTVVVEDQGRPSSFKSSGMAWEDLAVAENAFRLGL